MKNTEKNVSIKIEMIGTFSIVGFPLNLSKVPTKINKNGTNAYHNLILPNVMHINAKIQLQYGGSFDEFVGFLSNAQNNEYSIEYTNNTITIAGSNDQKNTPSKQHAEIQILGL